MYTFSSKPETSPVYCRTFLGNICDVKSFRDAVRRSGIEDMVVIADKGFGSDTNFGFLEEQGLRYLEQRDCLNVPRRWGSCLFAQIWIWMGRRRICLADIL